MLVLTTYILNLLIMANKYDFSRISLMWRPGKGHRRIDVGSIIVSKDGNDLKFEYSAEGVVRAKKVDNNFCGYPGLPLDQESYSSLQISEVFFGRLINNSRSDADDFYDFWLVDKEKVNDKLYVLAQTQGLSLGDMFEFVPQYFSSHKHSFITDIAGLSVSEFDLSKLTIGDTLDYEKEPENHFDTNAVFVSFKGEKIGYIKKGHNTIFSRKNLSGIKLSVWRYTNVPEFEKLYVKIDIKY